MEHLGEWRLGGDFKISTAVNLQSLVYNVLAKCF